MKKMTRHITVLLTALLAALPLRAQWNFDVSSVEAYIQDHKDERSMLLARSTLEASNKLLHELASEQADEYHDVNLELEKYTRAFDIIDLLYQSLRTVINVKNTYDNVRESLEGMRDLLERFDRQIIERGRVESADTTLLHVLERGVACVADDVQSIYRSFSDLVLYVSGASACSTAELMRIVSGINDALDTLNSHVNRTYYQAWRFIELRTGYWKRTVYRSRTTREMAESALERWIVNSNPYY